MSPLFSVIIPLYNKEKYIEKTIQSVLDQNFRDFEIVVVNDGSTDNSAVIVARMHDPRIRLITKENAGVAAARNTGIRSAEGKYICFLDADDLWEKDFLETVYSLFREFPTADMACPTYQVAYKNKVVHPVWKSVSLEKDSLINDFYEMATAPFWVCNCSCVAIKRLAFDKLDHWFSEGESVYEDFDLFLRLGRRCKVAHSNRICATYQRETETNARKNHKDKIVYSKSFMKTLVDLMEDRELSEQQKEWVKKIYDRRMVPYIFSLNLTGNKERAKYELKNWNPCKEYKLYKIGLLVSAMLPNTVLSQVQNIRMKVF